MLGFWAKMLPLKMIKKQHIIVVLNIDLRILAIFWFVFLVFTIFVSFLFKLHYCNCFLNCSRRLLGDFIISRFNYVSKLRRRKSNAGETYKVPPSGGLMFFVMVGSDTINRLPCPASDSTRTWPFIRSRPRRTIVSPSPSPSVS